MKPFALFFLLELKRSLQKKKAVILVVVALLSLYLTQDSITQYKNTADNTETFKKTEELRLQHYANNNVNGVFEHHFLQAPDPISIFFSNSCAVPQLTASLSSTNAIKIYNSLNGSDLFAEKSGGFKDFSGVFFLFGSLLALSYGYDALRRRTYLKFLANSPHHTREFYFMLINRFILLNLYFLVLTVLASLLIISNGVSPEKIINGHLILFQVMNALLILFFFSLGAAVGTIPYTIPGFAVLISIWFVLIFLIPGIVTKIVSINASKITSEYSPILQNMEGEIKFENKASNVTRQYQDMDRQKKLERELIEDYQKTELDKMHQMTQTRLDEMIDNWKYHQRISFFFPTSFYLTVNNEISSRGYSSFFNFYRNALQRKDKLMDYYIGKKIDSHNDSHNTEPPPANTPNQHVFFSKSHLPEIFIPGVIAILFYSITFLAISYIFLFKRNPKLTISENTGSDLENRSTYFILCKNQKYKDEFLHQYENKTEAVCLLDISGKDIDIELEPYQMVSYFTTIKGLSKEVVQANLERLGIKDITTFKRKTMPPELLLKIYCAVSLAGDEPVIVIDNLAKGKSIEFEQTFIQLITYLAASGKRVIYLSTEMYMVSQPIEERIRMERFNCLKVDFRKIILR